MSIQKWWDENGVLQMYLHRNENSDKHYSLLYGHIYVNNNIGFLYKMRELMTWCPSCSTSNTNMEIESEDYKETSHLSLYVRFPLVDHPGEYLLVWTTTPWTLAANVAAAVHPDLPYVKVEQDGEYYYLAEELLPVLKALKGRDKGDYPVVETRKGSDMIRWRRRGPYAERAAEQGVV